MTVQFLIPVAATYAKVFLPGINFIDDEVLEAGI